MENRTPEQIVKNMKHNKCSGTKIEIILMKELWTRGLRYRKNVKKVYGKPDLVFLRKKIAVFCDGEFWHGYDWDNRKKDFKTNREFWISKIEKNMERDRNVNMKLRSEGWTVIRFWGNDIKNNLKECADKIEKLVKE